MFSYMFKNRWMALIFVLTGAYGAVTLIGTEEKEGVVIQTAQKVQDNQTQRSGGGDWGIDGEMPREPREYEEDGAIDETLPDPWALDDSVSPDEFSAPFMDGAPIDDGTGFDPDPMIDPEISVQGSPLAGDAGVVILPE